ncbi:hypothetical protein MMC20_007419 [Loxospora ochrophaea]|nr:hypothetical protein [Loxospora ochrophaea]
MFGLPRRHQFAAFTFLVLFTLYLYYGDSVGIFTPPVNPKDKHFDAFWSHFSRSLLQARPKCSLSNQPIQAPVVSFEDLPPNSNDRPNLIPLLEKDIKEMRRAHSSFVKQLSDPKAPALPYEKNSSGIVTATVGGYLPEVIVGIRMLRRTGSTLPVEVFLESAAEYEANICDNVLPPLNARCVRVSDLQSYLQPVSRYQMKAFALLLSSFDNMLFLDADVIALAQPDGLFMSEPYISHGFVAWPDYWASTVSPVFYDIASINAPSVSERASSESGQLLLSKQRHTKTLKLIAYYSYYGLSHYFRLLSQGAVGAGDKETFVAAALSLKAPFYTVGEKIDTLGYFGDDNEFRGTGACQANPCYDYNSRGLGKAPSEPKRLFVHSQTYKANAQSMITVFRDEVGNRRMWGPAEGMIAKFGFDVEMAMWDEILYTACSLGGHKFNGWDRAEKVCHESREVYKVLFGEAKSQESS